MFSRFRRAERKGSVPSVVVLGGGYGGVYAALELQGAAKRGEIKLTLISRENFFLFQPMLAEVISGSISPLNVVSPIRRIVPHAQVHQAEVESVDTGSRTVAIRYPGHARLTTISYDHLIFAVGSATNLSQFPGVEEHGMSFKTLGDAFRLRNHLISMLEAANV
ncbi:MAG: FAD-dependent oxidoreductase, partial [Chloroflexi bacterium]|nr:FAD-dependent oxidoreductase [Chloroflexota bacterium]